MRRQLKDRTETLQVSQSATKPYRARSRKGEDQRVFRVFGDNGAATVPIKPSDERSPNLFDPAKTYIPYPLVRLPVSTSGIRDRME